MNAIKIIVVKLIAIRIVLTLFTQTRVDRTRHRAPFDAKMGQGLFSTRWNGLNFSVII
jgi:hypothetical protein